MATKTRKPAEGTVKFTGILNDEFPKQMVSDAVYRSGLAEHHKKAIYKEVSKGELSRDHSIAVKKILQAENTGGKYIPPVAGQL